VPGKLILCAGPIGNLDDAPPRLGAALSEADIVFAEDTRRARILLGHLGIKRPLRSYFAGNEADRSAEIEDRLAEGATVALLTDAGTPAIADPGLSAVRAAVAAGAEVTGVPGPSAVTLAVSLAGLPAERFVFEGFLPRSGRRRADRLRALGSEERTAVVFCAPGRLAGDLDDLGSALGLDRAVVVCRELTKLHEEVWRGTLGGAAEHWSAQRVRGEITVVVGGASPPEPDLEEALQIALALIDQGVAPSEACRTVAAETGVKRRALYAAVVERKTP
jgi:16S rRNA (cytidine1402-2'-O)-methyltransferase